MNMAPTTVESDETLLYLSLDLVRTTLRELLRSISSPEDDLDDAIVTYIAGILDDCNSTEDLSEIVVGFLPELTEYQDLDKRLDKLLQDHADNKQNVLSVNKENDSSAVGNRKTNPKNARSASKDSLKRSSEEQLLIELVPTLPEEIILYALHQKFCGNTEECAAYLVEVDQNDILSEYERYQMCQRLAEEKEKRDYQEKQEVLSVARKRIIDKYADQVEKETFHRPVVQWEDKPKRQVRYFQDRVVSTSGEKYFVIQEKEEYDGGSRGRVKTKGKRGKGWA